MSINSVSQRQNMIHNIPVSDTDGSHRESRYALRSRLKINSQSKTIKKVAKIKNESTAQMCIAVSKTIFNSIEKKFLSVPSLAAQIHSKNRTKVQIATRGLGSEPRPYVTLEKITTIVKVGQETEKCLAREKIAFIDFLQKKNNHKDTNHEVFCQSLKNIKVTELEDLSKIRKTKEKIIRDQNLSISAENHIDSEQDHFVISDSASQKEIDRIDTPNSQTEKNKTDRRAGKAPDRLKPNERTERALHSQSALVHIQSEPTITLNPNSPKYNQAAPIENLIFENETTLYSNLAQSNALTFDPLTFNPKKYKEYRAKHPEWDLVVEISPDDPNSRSSTPSIFASNPGFLVEY